MIGECPLNTKGDATKLDLKKLLAGSETLQSGSISWRKILLCVAMAWVALYFVPHRTAIPPRIHSDYAYMFIAADRLYEGAGYGSLQPIAPMQQWEYQYDYGFLTQWPAAYGLCVVGIRTLTGYDTIDAIRFLNLFTCAFGLVGWFAFLRSTVPRGISGLLFAFAGAGAAFPTYFLLDPSTDALFVAVLPYVLILALQVMKSYDPQQPNREPEKLLLSVLPFVALGFAAGTLVWIRYAAIAAPLGVGLFLALKCRSMRNRRLWQMLGYALGIAIPIVLLILLNKTMSPGGSVQQQLNLGDNTGLQIEWNDLARLWMNFVNLGYYDYHWYSRYVFALWPAALIIIGSCIPPARRGLTRLAISDSMSLSIVVALSLLGVLFAGSAVFRGKFDYIGLERYYLPARPLYFAMFVAPLLWIPKRWWRIGLCLPLVVICLWTVQQDWSRPLKRWHQAEKETTQYGLWACCFTPGASAFFDWLGKQERKDLIVVSNFHDYITLEIGIPALPLPQNEEQLSRWIATVNEHRGTNNPQIVFAVDPDNRYREYWMPDVKAWIAQLEAKSAPLYAAENAVVLEWNR